MDREQSPGAPPAASAVLEGLRCPVMLFTAAGELCLANPAARRCLAQQGLERHGLTAGALLAADWRELWQRLTAQGPLRLPLAGTQLQLQAVVIDGRSYAMAELEGGEPASAVAGREAAERRLAESEARYRLLMTLANDAILVADADSGVLEEANREAEHLLGRSREAIIGMHYLELFPPEDHDQRRRDYAQHVASGRSFIEPVDVVSTDGRRVPMSVRTNTLEVGGRRLIQGIFHDLSGIRQAEEQRLEREHRQREVLVREVHHRIKNNLQAVAALLRLRAFDQPDLAPMLGEAVTQVEAISLVHGLQAHGTAGVGLAAVVRAIVEAQGRLGGEAPALHEVDGSADLAIDPEQSVAVALIINELVTNALKHGEDGGAVAVRLASRTDGGAELEVSNRGRLPAGLDLAGRQGLGTGLDLAAGMVPDRGARLELGQVGAEVRGRLVLEPPLVGRAGDGVGAKKKPG